MHQNVNCSEAADTDPLKQPNTLRLIVKETTMNESARKSVNH